MRSRRSSLGAKGMIVAAASVTVALGAAPAAPAQAPTGGSGAAAVFRGDPGHAGVYAGPVIEGFGGLAWVHRTEGTVISTPAVTEEAVFVGGGDGRLRALRRRSGELLWSHDAGSPVTSSPAVDRERVYFGARDNAFRALDRRSGEVVWRLSTGGDVPFPWGHESGDLYTSSPTLAGGLVLFGSGDGYVYAVGTESGEVVWRHRTGGRVRATPAVADGVVYVGSSDGRFYALSLETGERLWTYETRGTELSSEEFGYDRRTIQSSAAVAGGTVFFGARDGFLYALDADSGELRWRLDQDGTSWVNSSPAVADGVVYVGSSAARLVQAVDAGTGEELWRFETPGSVWSSPAVVGGMLYVGDGAGVLHALDRESGEERWSYRTAGRILSSPVPRDGVLHFGSHDGGIYALRRAGGAPLRRAVFWDSAYVARTSVRAHRRVRDFLSGRGYRVLDAGALARFLEGRLEDGSPSVVVFAMDWLPREAAGEPGPEALLRRYLDAGGKVVWLGIPPLLFPRDVEPEELDLTDIRRGATEGLLGVSHDASNFDPTGVRPTPEGRRWGLRGWWTASWGADPEDVTDVLARSELGLALAWRRSYGGPPGSGFLRIYGGGWPDGRDAPDLLGLLIVAERFPPGG